ncbi:hypothetical protein [Holophaga foetida]|uniref:hypothetical protein n=1 Tax=Holophaga foetida TaxID=35839 RepID=UPI00024742AA|nr:hypothetical protein [Holophaga foetida]
MENPIPAPETLALAEECRLDGSMPWVPFARQIADAISPLTGIWEEDLDHTAVVLFECLNGLLVPAWSDLRSDLSPAELWLLAEATFDLDWSVALETGWIEGQLRGLGRGGREREVLLGLLAKVQAWGPLSRWAVLRVVANAFAHACVPGCAGVIANDLVDARFRAALGQ